MCIWCIYKGFENIKYFHLATYSEKCTLIYFCIFLFLHTGQRIVPNLLFILHI